MATKVQDVTPEAGSPALLARRLNNFPTGHSELLPKHDECIRNEVAPLLRKLRRPFVDIVGFASKLGFADKANSERLNKELSIRRTDEVERRIALLVPGVGFRQLEGRGSSESTGDISDDSGFWRAASVRVFEGTPPPPEPDEGERKPPTFQRDSTRFNVRITAFSDLGGIRHPLTTMTATFRIVDEIRKTVADFKYTERRRKPNPPIPDPFEIGVPQIPGFDKRTRAKTNAGGAGVETAIHFLTTKHCRLPEFVGRATLFQEPAPLSGGRFSGRLFVTFEGDLLRHAILTVPGQLIFKLAEKDTDDDGYLSFGELTRLSSEHAL